MKRLIIIRLVLVFPWFFVIAQYLEVRRSATVKERPDSELDLELVDSITIKSSNDPVHDKLSTLLKWYNDESVDNYERYRNHIIYNKYQHNRDRFNDHPEFVSKIW